MTPALYAAMAAAVAVAGLASANNMALLLAGIIIGILLKDTAGGGRRPLSP